MDKMHVIDVVRLGTCSLVHFLQYFKEFLSVIVVIMWIICFPPPEVRQVLASVSAVTSARWLHTHEQILVLLIHTGRWPCFRQELRGLSLLSFLRHL